MANGKRLNWRKYDFSKPATETLGEPAKIPEYTWDSAQHKSVLKEANKSG